MLVLALSLLAAVSTGAAPPYNVMFNEPYRTVSTVANTWYRMQTVRSSVSVSYMGMAQVPSNELSTRIIFTVHPDSDTSLSLPKVYIYQDRYLATNISTTFGNEMVIGPSVSLDTWFSFGISIGNGPDRNVQFYVANRVNTMVSNPTYSSKKVSLRGDMFTSSTAMTSVNVVTLSTNPVPVYVIRLSSIAVALSSDDFELYSTIYPPPYFYSIGAQIGGLSFERPSANLNISCPNNMTIVSVQQALYGRPIGMWPNFAPSPGCDLGSSALPIVNNACLGKRSCSIPKTNKEFSVDPCPGWSKWVAVSMICESAFKSSSPSTKAPISNSSRPSSSPSPSVWKSTSSISSLFVLSPSASPSLSSRPVTSPISNARKVSLTVPGSTLDFPDSVEKTLKTAFIRDLGSAFNVQSSRFVLVQFKNRTRTSTEISFVILGDNTDSDGSLLASAFNIQMQNSKSVIRTSPLLTLAADPTIPIDIVAVFVTTCGSDSYMIYPDSCPTSAAVQALPDSLWTRKELIWLLVAVVVVILAIIANTVFRRLLSDLKDRHDRPPEHNGMAGFNAPKYYVQQSTTYSLAASRSNNSFFEPNSSREVINAAEPESYNGSLQDIIMIPQSSGADPRGSNYQFFLNQPVAVNPSTASRNTSTSRLNRTRLDRLQHGARDKFSQSAHTVSDSDADSIM